MSRRRTSRPEHADAKVLIQCPEGHTLGSVVVFDGQPDQLRPARALGWKYSDPLAHPLAMTCDTCAAQGRHTDLRGSWERVREVARQTLTERDHSKAVYTLGG